MKKTDIWDYILEEFYIEGSYSAINLFADQGLLSLICYYLVEYDLIEGDSQIEKTIIEKRKRYKNNHRLKDLERSLNSVEVWRNEKQGDSVFIDRKVQDSAPTTITLKKAGYTRL